MSQQYYVIRKQDGDLEHAGHKYISKKKVNGKWRYIYDADKIKDTARKMVVNGYNAQEDKPYIDSSVKKSDKMVSYKSKTKGNNTKETYTFDTDDLLSSRSQMKLTTSGSSIGGGSFNSSTTTDVVRRGKIERGYNKVKKSVKKGAKAVDKYFKKKKYEKQAKQIVSGAKKKLKNMTNKK